MSKELAEDITYEFVLICIEMNLPGTRCNVHIPAFLFAENCALDAVARVCIICRGVVLDAARFTVSCRKNVCIGRGSGGRCLRRRLRRCSRLGCTCSFYAQEAAAVDKEKTVLSCWVFVYGGQHTHGSSNGGLTVYGHVHTQSTKSICCVLKWGAHNHDYVPRTTTSSK